MHLIASFTWYRFHDHFQVMPCKAAHFSCVRKPPLMSRAFFGPTPKYIWGRSVANEAWQDWDTLFSLFWRVVGKGWKIVKPKVRSWRFFFLKTVWSQICHFFHCLRSAASRILWFCDSVDCRAHVTASYPRPVPHMCRGYAGYFTSSTGSFQHVNAP